jgi:hypothetical protein
MTTSSSISVKARRGFIPDKTPAWAIRFKVFRPPENQGDERERQELS